MSKTSESNKAQRKVLGIQKEKIGKWERIGSIGIDTGRCWIGDPLHADLHRLAAKRIEEPNFQLGLNVSAGYGDGVYDVYARFTTSRRVAQVKIVFIE